MWPTLTLPILCHHFLQIFFEELARLPDTGSSRSLIRRALTGCLALMLCACSFSYTSLGQSELPPPQIAIPHADHEYAISVNADNIERWFEGQYEVMQCLGNVVVVQGENKYSAKQAVLWLDRNFSDSQFSSSDSQSNDSDLPAAQKMIIYLDDSVVVDRVRAGGEHTELSLPVDRMNANDWFGRLITTSNVHMNQSPIDVSGPSSAPLWDRAKASWQQEYSQIRQVSYVQQGDPYLNQPLLVSPQTGQTLTAPPTGLPTNGSAPYRSTPIESVPYGSDTLDSQTVYQLPQTGADLGNVVPVAGGQNQAAQVQTRVRINPRQSNAGAGIRSAPSSVPNETILTSTGGVRVLIDSDELANVDQFGQAKTSQIVIEADNVVAWTNQLGNSSNLEPPRWELYLEGNVEFVMGDRVIYAERMFYNATTRQGTILSVEMLTPVPSYRGLARLKAEVVQQNSENNWYAYGAALTSSRLGVPRYWMQSQDLDITQSENAFVDPLTGVPQFDAQTGQVRTEDEYFVTSRNNRVYLAGIPVFWWPTISTSLNNPSYYLESLRVGNDQIFGTQVVTGWNLYQILGIRNPPRESKWTGYIGNLDFRGVVFGTDFKYNFPGFLGVPGNVDGLLRAWFIDDRGEDNLGRGRRRVPLEEDFRGRIRWTHQHTFSPGFRAQAELGWLSDRNFLEQYFERDWDTGKDYETGLWLIRNFDNQSLQLQANFQINDFFTQTSWLPKLDHHIIGQRILNTNLTWHAHSHVGYGQFDPAEAPTNPVDLANFRLLDWEVAPAEGIRAGTRHELDLPFQAGAVKVTPYVLGDATFWEEDLQGNDLTRLYGQVGLRASLPLWRVDPTVHSVLLNLNGLAHKITFDTELLYADADEDFLTLPLYDQLNDDAQEHFQRRFIDNTFGGAIPAEYDERFFALRSLLQSNVSAPSAEIANDLAAVKIGMRNRWQTKRGLPGEARIIDWIEFDIEGTYFPDANRDNFGSDFGLVNYDFAWHIGNRLSILSDGYYDFFSQGLRTTSLGFSTSRPTVGSIYVGMRSIEGPISSNILTAQATYRMSDKWIFKGVSRFDFGEAGNIGQSISFIRVGESFLLRFGVNVNVSRDNVGFLFGIEPRFQPNPRLGRVGGVSILPASTEYLE